jgi:hypothetical protein
MDIRKYGVVIAVAILSAILVYSIADAVAPQVDYDRCYPPAPYSPDATRAQQTGCMDALPDAAAETACRDAGNAYEARYGVDGCVREYVCSDCYRLQQEAQEQRTAVIFYVAVGLGLLLVVIGFLLPLGSVHEWVGLGLIIGGVVSMFIGTVQYWSDLTRWMRPVVIAIELVILLVIVYKRMGDLRETGQETAAPVARSTRARGTGTGARTKKK